MRQLLTIAIFIVLIMPGAATDAGSDRLNIVTTTTLLADVVQNVAGDAADVTSLMGANTDPHSYQPTTRDIITLDEADLIFINGISLEGGLRQILEETEASKVVPLSACVPVLTGFEHDDEHEDHDDVEFSTEAGENCAAYYDELSVIPDGIPFVEADCETCDPHVWMNVQNVMLWTLLVRDTLSQLDPTNAEIYAENSAAYLEALTDLDEEIQDLVDALPEENRVLVTNHNVLGYFAHRYGFEIAGSVLPGFSTGVEPGPQEVLAIIEVIEDTGVPAIFVDNSASTDTASQIAEETGVDVISLYTGSLGETDGDAGTYVDYMRFNTMQIVDALATD